MFFERLVVLTDESEQVIEKLHERRWILHDMQASVGADGEEACVLEDVPLVQARVVLQEMLDQQK